MNRIAHRLIFNTNRRCLMAVTDTARSTGKCKGTTRRSLTFAKAQNLRPGIALSAAQIASLTTDIVWLQEESVTLADGSTTKALVPHVYATVRSNDLSADGKLLANASSSLISGSSVTTNTTGDINNSGSILGRALVNLSSKSGNINITAGAQTAADTVALQAGKDINITGAQVVANNNLTAQAGNNINITSTTQSSAGSADAYSFSQSGVDRMAGLYTRGPGILIASAANNVNLTAAQISTGGDALIAAGNTINLGTIVQSRSDNFHANDADNHFLSKSSSEVGSIITSTGNTTLQAGKDINARAATIQASGDLSASATNINITAGQSSASSDYAAKYSDGGFLSSSTTTIKNTASSTTAQASELGGTNISLNAKKDTSGTGGNITVTGSNVLAVPSALSAHLRLCFQAPFFSKQGFKTHLQTCARSNSSNFPCLNLPNFSALFTSNPPQSLECVDTRL